ADGVRARGACDTAARYSEDDEQSCGVQSYESSPQRLPPVKRDIPAHHMGIAQKGAILRIAHPFPYLNLSAPQSTRCGVFCGHRDDWSYEFIPRLSCSEPVPFISPTTIDMRRV